MVSEHFLGRHCLIPSASVGGFFRVFVTHGNLRDSVAIAASLLLIVLASVLLGTALPFALVRAGIDPAHAGSSIQVRDQELVLVRSRVAHVAHVAPCQRIKCLLLSSSVRGGSLKSRDFQLLHHCLTEASMQMIIWQGCVESLLFRYRHHWGYIPISVDIDMLKCLAAGPHGRSRCCYHVRRVQPRAGPRHTAVSASQRQGGAAPRRCGRKCHDYMMKHLLTLLGGLQASKLSTTCQSMLAMSESCEPYKLRSAARIGCYGPCILRVFA